MAETEERYRALFESALCSVFIHDLRGNFIDANETALATLGYQRKDLPSLSLSSILDSAYVATARKRIEEMIASGSSLEPFLYKVKKKNGDFLWMEVVSTLIHHDGKPYAVQGMAWNVTEQLRIREALEQSEARYRTIIETMNEGLSVLDRNGTLVLVNSRFCSMTGYRKEELIGKHVSIVLDRDNERILRNQWLLRKKGFAESYEITLTRKDLAKIETLVSPQPVYNQDGEFDGSIGIFTDITKMKHTERELRSYQERLRSLALEISMVEERERRYIARELQDTLGHMLTYCRRKLGELCESLSSPDVCAAIKEINQIIERTIHQSKALTDEFSTQILYENGLEAAVRWLGSQFQQLHGIVFRVEDDLKPKPLSDETNILLYQSVRELFMNAVRHARAKNVSVRFERDYRHIRIDVRDDGVGFDVSKMAFSSTQKDMFGLFSIYERLTYLGGHVHLESGPGQGTRFTLVAPLKSPGRK